MFIMENKLDHGKGEVGPLVQGKTVGATMATLTVIRHAARAAAPFALADLVRATNINRSTGFNILKTLVQESVLAFDPDSKSYALTPYLSRLLSGVDERESDRLRQGINRLAGLFDVSVTYWTVRGDSLVLSAAAEGGADIKLTQQEGLVLPLLSGAAGRAVLTTMDMDDAGLMRLLAATGNAFPPALAKLKADLERARRRGWADDGGSLQPGIRALAVAIRGEGGRAVGACAALMLKSQFNSAHEKAVAAALVQIAESRMG